VIFVTLFAASPDWTGHSCTQRRHLAPFSQNLFAAAATSVRTRGLGGALGHPNQYVDCSTGAAARLAIPACYHITVITRMFHVIGTTQGW